MKCPYCVSEVNEAANVCATCRRDIYLFKPLQLRVESLETELAASAAEKKSLADRIASLEADLARHVPPPEPVQPAKPRSLMASIALTALLTLVLLLISHLVIVVLYDLKPLLLRVASLLIPLPFGYLLYAWHPRRFWTGAVVATIVSLIAVLSMSAVVGYVDKTPILPQDLRDWREFIEYACSIAFAFVTGMLLAVLGDKRRGNIGKPNAVVLLVARLFARDTDGEMGVKKLVEKISGIAGAVAPVVSGAISVYTGIKAVLGDS
jgi:hypothetical protein